MELKISTSTTETHPNAPGSLANKLVLHRQSNQSFNFKEQATPSDIFHLKNDLGQGIYSLNKDSYINNIFGYITTFVDGRFYAVDLSHHYSYDDMDESGPAHGENYLVPYNQSPYWNEELIKKAGSFVISNLICQLQGKEHVDLNLDCQFMPKASSSSTCFKFFENKTQDYSIENLEKLLGFKSYIDNVELAKANTVEALVYNTVSRLTLLKTDREELLIVFPAVGSLVPVCVYDVKDEELQFFSLVDVKDIEQSLNGQLNLNNEVSHRAIFHAFILPLLDRLRMSSNELLQAPKKTSSFLTCLSYCPFEFFPLCKIDYSNSYSYSISMTVHMHELGLSMYNGGSIDDSYSAGLSATESVTPAPLVRAKDTIAANYKTMGFNTGNEKLTSYSNNIKQNFTKVNNKFVAYWNSVLMLLASTDIRFDYKKVIESRKRLVGEIDSGKEIKDISSINYWSSPNCESEKDKLTRKAHEALKGKQDE